MEAPQPEAEVEVIDLVIEPDETRVQFAATENTAPFEWSSGDQIAVHLSQSSPAKSIYDVVTVTPGSSTNTATYLCSTTSKLQRDKYAIYPADIKDDSNYGNSTLKVMLPTSYNIVGKATTWSPVPMIAQNGPSVNPLVFRQLGGLLRIRCDNVPKNTKTITVTLDKGVTGSFTVSNPTTTAPSISAGTSSSTVTFTISDNTTGITAAQNEIYLNIPLPKGTYTSAAVVCKNASETVTKTYTTKTFSVVVDRKTGIKLHCSE